MNDHEKRILKIEQDRTPLDDDLAKRLLRARDASRSPPTKTRAQLEKIANDPKVSRLERRIAQGQIQAGIFIGATTMAEVREKLAREAKAKAEGADLA